MSKNKKQTPTETKKKSEIKPVVRQIKNAVIRDVLIGITDQGIFTCWLVIGLGGQSQGYGGFNLGANNSAHDFITSVLNVVAVKDIKGLIGKAIRIDHTQEKIFRVGHYLDEKWFDYETSSKLVGGPGGTEKQESEVTLESVSAGSA